MGNLPVVSEDEIRNGRATDIYFQRTVDALDGNPEVVMEAWIREFPNKRYRFGVLSGVADVLELLDGRAEVQAMRDGQVFFPNEPVLQVKGKYKDFALLETAILGCLSKSSGISTKAARVRLATKGTLLSFGTRRAPPQTAIVVDRACYIGGFDGISNTKSAEFLGLQPQGTMPHSLILCAGSAAAGFGMYDKLDAPKVALVDTFDIMKDLKAAVDVFGKRLTGVRIDSGDLAKEGRRVRKYLDARGMRSVKLFASGGLDEHSVRRLSKVYDGFGVGTRVADAPTMDFALKIVEVDGKPLAKRTNVPGRKTVLRNKFRDIVAPFGRTKNGWEELLVPAEQHSRSAGDARKLCLDNLGLLPKNLRF